MRKIKYKHGTPSFFKALLAQIIEARKSSMHDVEKIWVVLTAAESDINSIQLINDLAIKTKPIERMGMMNRFANKLLFVAEEWAINHKKFCYQNIENEVDKFMSLDAQEITFNYPSYHGIFEEDEDGLSGAYSLPDELKNFKGRDIVVRVDDMERFTDTFSSLDTANYKRAFEILAELDKRVLDVYAETGKFPSDPWISFKKYDGDGDAIFEFSHFEIDTRDPDSEFSTLYVVYGYITTAV